MNKMEKLGTLCSKLGSGATPTGGQNAYKLSGVSLIRSQNVQDFYFSNEGLAFIDGNQAKKLDNVEVREGDILLNITGDSIARTCIVPKEILPARVNQHVSIIRVNERIDKNYLLYYLLFRKNYLLTISRVGGTRNALTKEALENIEICLNKNEKAIGNILSYLDTKILLNHKTNGELASLIKTLYDYWFVQFDFPDKNGKPYKSSGGKMVYSELIKRVVPEGWEINSLDYFISSDKSGDWGKENPEGNYVIKVECIRGADVNGINGKGEINTPVRFILEKNIDKILQPADLVIEISGGSPTQSTGRLACITNDVLGRFQNPLICSNFCKAVSLRSENYLFYFTHTWNKAYDNGVFFGFEGKTSGIKNFLFESLVSSYNVVIPAEKQLMAFQAQATLIEKLRQKNLKQNQELAKLRDWLLPMLMNGQVTVNDASVQINKALNPVPEGTAVIN